MATLRHQPFLRFKGLYCLYLRASFDYNTSVQLISELPSSTFKHLPLRLNKMSSRASTGARPGARFAQFKLVLLGSYILLLIGSKITNYDVGESAVGKVAICFSSCI